MPRILVIDDDAAIAELVAVNLEMAGYEVTQAEDGIKGQALAIQMLPDLIMLDLMLPRVDGFTVCQRLRRDDRTSDIPVLMLTALSQTQDKVEGFNSGADFSSITVNRTPSNRASPSWVPTQRNPSAVCAMA